MESSHQDTIKLEELVDFYVSQVMTKGHTVDSVDPVDSKEKQRMVPMLKESISSSIRKEIRDSLTQEEADAIYHNAAKMHRRQELQHRTQQIRNLLLEGIIFSFFVGLLVNLATELLDTFFSNYKLFVAAICIIIITLLYFYRLLGQIKAFFHSDQEGDSDFS